MFDRRRREIYLFYDMEKIREMYQTFKIEQDDDCGIEYIKTLNTYDYEQLINELFKSETFKSEVEDTIYTLETEIIYYLDDLVMKYVNEKLSQRDT